MSVGGFGPGNVGGQQQPMQRDIETSAWAETAKLLAGLIHPDELRPFVETNPHTTWKYSTESGRPELDHILTTLRMNIEGSDTPDREWRPFYHDFISRLPDAILAELEYQLSLPLAEAREEFIILNRIAVLYAMSLSWLTRITAPKSPNSDEIRSSEMYRNLSVAAFVAGMGQSDEIAKQAREYLTVVGPNDPNYDSMTGVLTEYDSLCGEIRQLAKQIAEGMDPNSLGDDFNWFANKIHLLLANVTNASFGGRLQILIPSLQALETTTAALSIENGSPPLLISLTAALSGIHTSESAGGLMGPYLQRVMEGVVEGVLAMTDFETGATIGDLQGLINDLAEFANNESGGEV